MFQNRVKKCRNYKNISENCSCFFAVNVVFDIFFATFFIHEKLLFFEYKLDDWESSRYHWKKKNLEAPEKKGKIIIKRHFGGFIICFSRTSLNTVRIGHKTYSKEHFMMLTSFDKNRSRVYGSKFYFKHIKIFSCLD